MEKAPKGKYIYIESHDKFNIIDLETSQINSCPAPTVKETNDVVFGSP